MTRIARLWRAVTANEGGSLPPVLIAIAVGAILITPFLAAVSSRMLATRAATEDGLEYYAADSGIEYGIWLLSNDPTFEASVLASFGSPVTAPDNPTVNGVPTTVTVTAELGWVELADTPAPVGAGGSLARISGSLFTLRGDGTRNFWRYNIDDNTWTTLASAPDDVGEGGALAMRDGDTLYALRGENSTDFWRYRPSTNSWTSCADTEVPVGPAGSLAYLIDPGSGGGGEEGDEEGGQDCESENGGELYAFHSPSFCVPPWNPSICFDRVWRYDQEDDDWDERALNPGETGAGAALTADGAGNLLAFRGDGTNDFWSYQPDNWDTSPADPPSAVGAGADLSSDGTQYTYALRGGGTTDAWRYDQNSDSWSNLPDTPAAVEVGGSISYGGNDEVYALRGGGTSDFWRLGTVYDIRAYQDGDLVLTSRIAYITDEVVVLLWDIE